MSIEIGTVFVGGGWDVDPSEGEVTQDDSTPITSNNPIIASLSPANSWLRIIELFFRIIENVRKM